MMADEAAAIDSRAILGLLAYIQKIVVTGDAWLSFPLSTPLAYNAAQLETAMGPAPDAAAHALLAEFSTMMNYLPSGLIWPPENPQRLDEVLRDILADSEWALNERCATDQARYLAAITLTDPHNPEMAMYVSLQDAWIRAREFKANHPDDPTGSEAERDAREALLSHPEKAQIDRALDDLVALDEQGPAATREQLESAIDSGTGTFDDAIDGRYSPVRLMPRTIVTAALWDTVSLDRSKLHELFATAPQELASRLVIDTAAEDAIQQISFEYATAQLHRPWFDERLFKLRCWRFADPDRLLSDGGQPAAGECAAYVRAVVLARNIVVRQRDDRPTALQADNNPASFLTPTPAEVGPDRETIQVLETMMDNLNAEIAALQVEAAMLQAHIDSEFGGGFFGDLFGSANLDHLALVQAQEEEMVDQLHATWQQWNELTSVQDDFSRLPGNLSGVADVPAAALAAAEQTPQIALRDSFPIGGDATPESLQPNLITTFTPTGVVSILALICNPVPRCPDPNPDFDWG